MMIVTEGDSSDDDFLKVNHYLKLFGNNFPARLGSCSDQSVAKLS